MQNELIEPLLMLCFTANFALAIILAHVDKLRERAERKFECVTRQNIMLQKQLEKKG